MSEELLNKKPLVTDYLEFNPRQLSYFSFVTIFIWQDFFDFEFRVFDDHLCVFARSESGVFLYLPPLGKRFSLTAYQRSFDYMTDQNGQNRVSRIENVPFQNLPHLKGAFHCVQRCEEFYYYKNDIACLKGGPYKSQRGLYNHFIKHYTYRYGNYEDSLLEECLGLLEEWTRNRADNSNDFVYNEMLQENLKVTFWALKYYKELDLVGRVVWVDNKIRAYTFGFELSDDTFCILFEVADITFKGLACFIFREFAQDKAWAGYRFINAMDAFAMEKLRKTKMGFRPSILMPVYSIRKKEGTVLCEE